MPCLLFVKDRMYLLPSQQLRRKIKVISTPLVALSVFSLAERKISKQTNNGKRCHSLSLDFNIDPFLILLGLLLQIGAIFVFFLIPLLFGYKSKERLVFSSLTHCFLDKLTDYLNLPSSSLPFARSTWKSTELILSPVRVSLACSKYFLSYIIHINYCTFDLCNSCA